MYKTERLELYTKVRNKFSNFCTLNDSAKFIFLMQSNDAHVITWMAKFVYRSMSKRSYIILSEVQEKDETLGWTKEKHVRVCTRVRAHIRTCFRTSIDHVIISHVILF